MAKNFPKLVTHTKHKPEKLKEQQGGYISNSTLSHIIFKQQKSKDEETS